MKKILLTIAAVITLAAFFAGCKGPNTPSKGGGASSQQQGGSSTSEKITITVAGDKNVEFKTTTRSFKIDKNKTWADVKTKAEELIKYKDGYENDKWKLNGASGTVIVPTYKFETSTTVYAVSKQTSAPAPEKITITVAGDGNVEFKTTTRSFKIDKNKTWADVKIEAEKLIKYKAGYENDKWKLNNELGQDIPDNHQFNADATVYAVPKKKTITITIAGDSHTQIATVDDRNKLKRDYGVTWAEIKGTADNLITGSDANYTFSAWKLNSNGTGADIQPTHKFTTDTTVYAISKRTHVILTIRGDANIIVPNPDTHIVAYDSSWEDNKATVEASLSYQSGFKLKGWKRNGSDGPDLGDLYRFKNDTLIYALSKPDKVKIIVKGDEHVRITPAPANEFIVDDGTKWKTIEATAISKITGYDPRYRLSYWKIDDENGGYIDNDTTFEGDTVVYAVSEALPEAPVSEGVKVNGVTITGKNPSCPLPSATNDWKGVFPAGRDVILSSYTIGKNEVSVKIWDGVYYWAKGNGYTFEFDGEGHEDNPPPDDHPITKVSWRDCIVWCNAYTELTYGTTEHCVYRESSAAGAEALKDANDADGAYFDQSKKGFRLPTEAEWEYAARYQDNATNAEQYGTVYLTKVNSASGAKQPIGFEGMTGSPNFTDLRTETARVAVFNKYYNGTSFVEQSPAVTGLANVGTKAANKLGLIDMSGNASEWCWDRYSTTLSSGLVTDPIGSTSPGDTYRVLRGGNWSLSDKPKNEKAVYGCMTGKRDNDSSHNSYDVVGFRLVWKE